MGVLQSVIREIGDIVNRLSVSSKEKQKIQEEIQSLGKKPGGIGCKGLGDRS